MLTAEVNRFQQNNLIRANRLGYEHGKQGQYNPPHWIVVKMGLWLTAYQTGHAEGERERKHVGHAGGAR